MTHESEQPHESLFDRYVRFGSGKDNNIYLSQVWNGTKWLTVPSYTKDPFATIGVEAKREIGICRRTITHADIDRIHTLAAQVEAAYGSEAVGELPPLTTEPNDTQEAA